MCLGTYLHLGCWLFYSKISRPLSLELSNCEQSSQSSHNVDFFIVFLVSFKNVFIAFTTVWQMAMLVLIFSTFLLFIFFSFIHVSDFLKHFFSVNLFVTLRRCFIKNNNYQYL